MLATGKTINDRFIEYYETEWNADKAYTISDFAEIFGIEVRLARYYLMKMVDNGLLCQIKHQGSTWYVKREHYDTFKEFVKTIGVRLI